MFTSLIVVLILGDKISEDSKLWFIIGAMFVDFALFIILTAMGIRLLDSLMEATVCNSTQFYNTAFL